MPRPARTALLWILVGSAGPGAALGQGAAEVKAKYTKYDYRIPMRDGVRLFTSVYVPKDLSKPYPILLNRSPYSVAPYGIDRYRENLGPSPLFGKAGYIVAYQDVRGCYLSEGKFVDIRPQVAAKKGPQDIDESSDAYDTIDWLVKNVAGNNGKVGTWGISYPGFYAAASTIDAHPALKAASPQAPLVDWFLGDDIHHNGALFLNQEFNFEANFGPPRPEPGNKPRPRFEHGTPDAYQFFLDLGPLANVNERYFKGLHPNWEDVFAHGTYDDYWKARALLPHLKDIKPAVLTVGGWFDNEDLFGPLNTYKRIEATSTGAANTLVMGPWVHGGWSRGDGEGLGPVRFNAKTGVFFRESIEFPFFEHYLKGEGKYEPTEAWAFETGRNTWHRHEAWRPPPPGPPAPLARRRDARLRSPRRRRRRGVRRVHQRPGPPRPVHERDRDQRPAELRSRGPAGSPRSGPTC